MNTRMALLEELNRLRHDILAMATRVEEDLGRKWRNGDRRKNLVLCCGGLALFYYYKIITPIN